MKFSNKKLRRLFRCPPSQSHGVRVRCSADSNTFLRFNNVPFGLPRAPRKVPLGGPIFTWKKFLLTARSWLSSSPLSSRRPLLGGGSSRSTKFPLDLLHPFLQVGNFVWGSVDDLLPDDYITYKECRRFPFQASPLDVVMYLPLDFLAPRVTYKHLRALCKAHHVSSYGTTLETMMSAIGKHVCDNACSNLVSVFERSMYSRANPFPLYIPPAPPANPPDPPQNLPPPADPAPSDFAYPPSPLSTERLLDILREWSHAVSLSELEESACAACGQLSLVKTCEFVSLSDPMLSLLIPTKLVSNCVPTDPLLCSAGVQGDRVRLCRYCHAQLKRRAVPRKALVNGLWLGDVPEPLRKLNYVEKIMVAKYRHNVSVVRVAKGQRKMMANAIVFPQPVAQFARVLPPTKKELDEVLVVVFTGAKAPSAADFKRTPFLVRPAVVKDALDWLIANHSDYADVVLSLENLKEYESDPEKPPVSFEFRATDREGNVELQNLPSYGGDTEIGSADGPCPLAVAGLVGEHLSDLSTKQKVAIALQHFDSGQPFMLYGRSADPESIYGNPQYYPAMFPWLFPYGYGGFDNNAMRHELKRATHIRCLLMYYDRRFQTDEYFSFLVFNQVQIASSVRGGYLVTARKNFDDVTDKILSIDRDALQRLTERALENGFVRSEDDDEKAILQLVSNLDHIGGHVPGSNAQRRYQRNEIRSLMYEMNAPAFFITFAPADFKSPLCLYYAGKRIDLSPLCPLNDSYNSRMKIIAANPVACARFFHLMVTLFIKIILKADSDEEGLFGKTSAYYGTVEEQGRLTLHLHLLLWIENSLSPQAIRDNILANNEEFKAALVAWLESTLRGDFSTGDLLEISARMDCKISTAPQHTGGTSPDSSVGCPGCINGDPTMCLPPLVPQFASDEEKQRWLQQMLQMTDEVLLRSNLHIHKGKNDPCTRPDGSCKARYPRETIPQTEFDENGNLLLRKTEKWINTFSVVITQSLRCNSDVTCLLSGTQVKAVIAYVTDYITKSSLKCHVIFEAIRTVLDRNPNILNNSKDRGDAARRLLTKIVNATIAKQEIGAPMVCAHLLGHGDHYTNMKFKPFYWYPYVAPVARAWDFKLSDKPEKDDPDNDRVVIKRTADGVLPWSKVHDYLLRPPAFEDYSLYDFMRLTVVKKLNADTSDNLVRSARRTPNAVFQDFTSPDDAQVESASSPDPDALDLDDDTNDDINDIPVSRQCYQFCSGHPNRNTHAVFKLKDEKAFNLNYIGTRLPRPDKGDRERYSLIMLALFKPNGWRDPKKIKAIDSSWSDAFDGASFSSRAVKVMSNMNVLYECYEASHDYSARRRQAQAHDTENVLMTENIRSFTLVSEGDIPPDNEDEPDFLQQYAIPSEREIRAHENAMIMLADTAAEILTIFPSNDEPPPQTAHGIDPSVVESVASSKCPSKGWKAVVTEANKQRVLSQRHQLNSPPVPGSSSENATSHRSPNQLLSLEGKVSIMTKLLLSNEYGVSPLASDHCPFEDRIAQDFCLNLEQNRAFRIICAHLRSKSNPDTLRMYLGGIGGTGKSTVIKAIITFLEARDEAHRYIVLTPTGSAACLLEGSTYHSALGLNPKGKTYNPNTLDDLKDRFGCIDLIFLDEVSMLSCEDMYRISRQLCEAFGKPMEAFGGKHVVFAGDFGQLQPAGKGTTSLYSNRFPLDTLALKKDGLIAALGRSIWHQFTTVVILRENMRQRGMSEEDKKFRTCLENMRYARCTADDLALLKTRIAKPDGPSLREDKFRNVAVITPRNAQRDAWNLDGVRRFASETGQSLHRFHCIDSSGRSNNIASVAADRKKQRRAMGACRKSNLVPAREQQQLWSLPPSLTLHVPSKLDVCIGLPVMLKFNEATELCATNGAEANVVSWESAPSIHGTQCLKTLFVKLKDPPKNMKLPTLPENVVPLTSTPHDIECSLATKVVSVSRTQVSVLPNFAMTDYGAQGRTRPCNPVDLRKCRGHQSVYTCLSRSSSLEGTLILYPFNTYKITKGATGDLRREYKELEILDDITRMRQDAVVAASMPPPHSCRNVLILWYQRKFGKHHVPPQAHAALRTREKCDLQVDYAEPTESIANYLETIKPLEKVRGKRKRRADDEDEPDAKKARSETPSGVALPQNPAPNASGAVASNATAPPSPLGFLWDSNDWSCAYDAMLGCLWNVYRLSPSFWSAALATHSDCLNLLTSRFESVQRGLLTLENARDNLRDVLFNLDPNSFPRRGASMTDIMAVTEQLFGSPRQALHQHRVCHSCGNTPSPREVHNAYFTAMPWMQSNVPAPSRVLVRDLLHVVFQDLVRSRSCRVCNGDNVDTSLVWSAAPPILAFELQPDNATQWACLDIGSSMSLTLPGTPLVYNLMGIVYLGGEHFTCRFIDKDFGVWSHDGVDSRREMTRETYSMNLTKQRSRQACLLLYRLT
ncbi:hypothetical protein NLI96_g11457 [Meripilus lineatus]|uniref:ATP-dependent DNA helicase n=1 Tax=Meripilus lineatus TaxID=2056292 RepID=A0AAD5YDD0_9APHY|nr:hypothetical protein NLI96_g11457 [Physisporinus lineatus]